MAGEVKGFIFTWAAKQKNERPEFTLLPSGPHRFNYEVRMMCYVLYNKFIYY